MASTVNPRVCCAMAINLLSLTNLVSYQPCVEFISRTSCIFGILRSGICSHRQNLLRFSDDGEADAADPAQSLAATIFMFFIHVCGGILMQLILFVSWYVWKGCSMTTPPFTLGDKKCLQGSLTSRHRCWNAKWQWWIYGFSHSLGFD